MLEDSSGQCQLWRTLFQERRTFFALAAEALSPTREAMDQVLSETLLIVERTPFHRECAEQTALRSLVKAALDHKTGVQPSYLKALPAAPMESGHHAAGMFEELPWAERAAFCLCSVLHYSRHDSALVMGVSDAQIDQLAALAERRLAGFDKATDGSLTVLFESVSARSLISRIAEG